MCAKQHPIESKLGICLIEKNFESANAWLDFVAKIFTYNSILSTKMSRTFYTQYSVEKDATPKNKKAP